MHNFLSFPHFSLISFASRSHPFCFSSPLPFVLSLLFATPHLTSLSVHSTSHRFLPPCVVIDLRFFVSSGYMSAVLLFLLSLCLSFCVALLCEWSLVVYVPTSICYFCRICSAAAICSVGVALMVLALVSWVQCAACSENVRCDLFRLFCVSLSLYNSFAHWFVWLSYSDFGPITRCYQMDQYNQMLKQAGTVMHELLPPKKDQIRASVLTVAGDGTRESSDGVGKRAKINKPYACCMSGDRESILFTEYGSQRIRRFYCAGEESNNRFRQFVLSVLMSGGLLPLPPLISIIADYFLPDGMTHNLCCTAPVQSSPVLY